MTSLHTSLWSLGFAGVGVWLASRPGSVLRLTNAYYAWLGLEGKATRQEIDRWVWLQRGIRVAGLCMALFGCFVFFDR
jgi:hypothetical protein